MPTDPTENPDPLDPLLPPPGYRSERDRQREKERNEIESMFAELICVQHLLLCWYLQAGFEHRLRHCEIGSFDAIFSEFERTFDCSRSSPSMHRRLAPRIDLLMDRYLRSHTGHNEDGSSFNTARKALETPHKILMPIIWEIEKRPTDKYQRYYRDNLLAALQAKRRLIEDLNGIHTTDR